MRISMNEPKELKKKDDPTILKDDYFENKLKGFNTVEGRFKVLEDHIVKLQDGSTLYDILNNCVFSIYAWVDKDNELIAACDFAGFKYKYKDKNLIGPYNCKIYNNYKNVLENLFRYLQKMKKCILICDNIKTDDGKNIWIKWIREPGKYNIKWWSVFDTKEEKMIDYTPEKVEELWRDGNTDNPESKDKIVVVEFDDI